MSGILHKRVGPTEGLAGSRVHQFGDAIDRLSCRADAQAWQQGVNQAGQTGSDHSQSNSERAGGVLGIGFSDFLGVFEQQFSQHRSGPAIGYGVT